jgi:hypothetical protein
MMMLSHEEDHAGLRRGREMLREQGEELEREGFSLEGQL